jgi:hypothetical protein
MCFSIEWLLHILIVLVVIVAVIALLRLLVTFIAPRLGLAAEIVDFITAAIRIIIWAVVCIAAIIFIGDLIACLLPYAGIGTTGRLR